MFPRRPRRGETEEDLLRQMEGFQRENPSAAKEVPPRPKPEPEPEPALPPSANLTLKSTVLERNVDRAEQINASGMAILQQRKTQLEEPGANGVNGAFPEVFTADRGVGVVNASPPGQKKRSLFARQMQQKLASRTSTSRPAAATATASTFGPQSRVLQGSGLPGSRREVDKIHRENVEKLESMSPEQLAEARAQVMSALSPEALAFLQRKHDKSTSSGNETVKSNAAQVPAISDAPEAPAPPMEVDEKVKETTAPQTSSIQRHLIHMDRVESDKLAWTGDLPPTPAESKRAGFSARFDFEGQLLPYDADVPVTAALHHHGDEPERAGYTLEELLTLSRSSNAQQKALALNTLARVVQTVKQGRLDGAFEENLLQTILSTGLVFVLRTTLDEQAESLREAALFCLRQLLDNQYIELVLDVGYVLAGGHVAPSLPTDVLTDREKRAELAESREQLKDDELLKLDVVQGLLQTDLLQRLAYLLKTKLLSPTAAKNTFNIVIRLARHSLQSAKAVLGHDSLISTSLQMLQDAKTDQTTCMLILKLVRVLMSWSRGAAQLVLSRFDFAAHLPRYLDMDEGKVALTVEAFRLWDTCLRYGYLSQMFDDLYPLVMNYLVTLRRQVDVCRVGEGSLCNIEVACAVLKVLEGAMCCQTDPQSHLRWGQFIDATQLVRDCTAHLSQRRYDDDDDTDAAFRKLLAACLNTINTSLLCMAKSEEQEAIAAATATIYQSCVVPLAKSSVMQSLLSSCSRHSAILSKMPDGRARDPSSLPSVAALTWKGDLVPVIDKKSPFSILRAFTNMVHSVTVINKDLSTAELREWLGQSALLDYVRQVIAKTSKTYNNLLSNWFTEDETVFLAYLLLSNCILQTMDATTTWNLSHSVLCHFHVGQETMAHRLLRSMVSNVEQIEIAKQFGAMTVQDGSAWKQESEAISKNLPTILELYAKYVPVGHDNFPFGHERPGACQSLTVGNAGEALLPRDWIYLPLLHLSNLQQQQQGDDRMSDEDEEIATKAAVACLQWVNLHLMQQRPNFFTQLEVAVQYSRVVTLFMASSSLFLDVRVRQYLKFWLRQVFATSGDRRQLCLDKQALPGIDSTVDFYRQVLAQYVSVSYGDPVFGAFVLLATTGSRAMKVVLWIDNHDMLRSLILGQSDLPAGLNNINASFVDGSENVDVELFRGYVRAVISKDVTRERNPLLFEIACANVKAAVKSGDDKVKVEIGRLRDRLELFGVFDEPMQ